MAWSDFKRTGGWNVNGLGLGGTNPWSLATGNNLTFHGNGTGDPTNDIVKKNGTQIGSECTYKSGDKVDVKYAGDGSWYTVTRSGTLSCKPRNSGSISWSATEG